MSVELHVWTEVKEVPWLTLTLTLTLALTLTLTLTLTLNQGELQGLRGRLRRLGAESARGG